jgi:hypothetical protein
MLESPKISTSPVIWFSIRYSITAFTAAYSATLFVIAGPTPTNPDAELFKELSAMKLEGMVAKRLDSLYVSGRTRSASLIPKLVNNTRSPSVKSGWAFLTEEWVHFWRRYTFKRNYDHSCYRLDHSLLSARKR